MGAVLTAEPVQSERRRRRRSRSARRFGTGVSLLELVLVLAIVAVMAAMAVPRYGGSAARYRAQMAARRAAADLELVRRRARAASADRSVTFDTGAETYLAASLGEPNNPSADYRVDLGHAFDVDIVSASFQGQPTATFDGYGIPVAAGQVVIRAGDYQQTVVLDAQGGAVRVE